MHWLREGLVRLPKRPSRVTKEGIHAKVNTVPSNSPKPPALLGRQRKIRREISENRQRPGQDRHRAIQCIMLYEHCNDIYRETCLGYPGRGGI